MFPRLILLLSTLVLLVPGTAVAADPEGVWPLSPHEVVVGFDPPTDTWGAGHRGVDLLGREGQLVHAALPGRVSFVGRIAGRGVIVVDHGDTRTTYEPVGAAPRVGTTVSAGEAIGRLEAAGSHCLPRVCLHWGWIRGEVYLDPLLLVGAGPVRLLPPGGLSALAPAPTFGFDGVSVRAAVRLGARMGLLVGLPEPVGRHVGVELRGGQ